MNAKDVRKELMEMGKVALAYKRYLIEGITLPEELKFADKKTVESMFELMQKIAEKTADAETFDAKSTSDIIEMLTKGEITPQQAKELMLILKLKSDIDELPRLLEILEKEGN